MSFCGSWGFQTVTFSRLKNASTSSSSCCCSVAQSCVQLFATHGLQHARLPCPSPSPEVCLTSCPPSLWCHLTISSSVVPFSSCLQSFPESGSFPVSGLFSSGGQSNGASASSSSKILVQLTLGAKQDSVPSLHCCFLTAALLTAAPLSLHPFPSLISNCLNLACGTQGKSWRLRPIRTKKEMWDTERFPCPGTLQGPAQFQVLTQILRIHSWSWESIGLIGLWSAAQCHMERRVAPKLDFSLLSNVTKSSRRKLFLWILPDGSAPIIPTADLPTHLQVLSVCTVSIHDALSGVLLYGWGPGKGTPSPDAIQKWQDQVLTASPSDPEPTPSPWLHSAPKWSSLGSLLWKKKEKRITFVL